jgi:hypothetical protein
MQLTPHDLHVLQLASRDAEGRLTFYIAEDGSIALMGKGEAKPMFAEDSLPKLEDLGLMTRELSRSYVLTPEGWEAVRNALT